MSGTQIVIYHNPRCSKSRETLALIRQKGIEPEIVEYLKTPPSKEALRGLLRKLALEPAQLVRKGEDVYRQSFAGKALNDEQWLDALAANPVLIERPIVVKGSKAVLGRPPENVLDLLA